MLIEPRDPKRNARKAARARETYQKKRARGVQMCGARTKQSCGRPCQARGLQPSGRCKLHGGMSTGPRTPEGKAKALACLELARRRKA